jgi:hypothetical protein
MLGTRISYTAEEAAMIPPIVTAVGQARLDDMHRKAQRDALARAARRAHRNTRKHQPAHRATGLLAAVARWARRPGSATASS